MTHFDYRYFQLHSFFVLMINEVEIQIKQGMYKRGNTVNKKPDILRTIMIFSAPWTYITKGVLNFDDNYFFS